MNRSHQQVAGGLRKRLQARRLVRPRGRHGRTPSFPNLPSMGPGRGTFRQRLRNFYGNDVKHIADNPQEYSDFVSEKAERTAMVARAASTVKWARRDISAISWATRVSDF